MLEKLIRQLVDRRSELESVVFRHPPSDWNEFQRRFGQWIELERMADELMELAKGIEKDN